MTRPTFSLNRFLLTAFFCLSVMGISAQTMRGTTLKKFYKSESYDLVKAYMDSLTAVQAQLDKQPASESHQMSGDMYRLFMPATFYHSMAHDMMKIDDDSESNSLYTSAINQSLMNIYLNHPELLKNTQGKIDKIGPVGIGIVTPIRNKAELVKQVHELPQQVDIVSTSMVVTKPNFWNISGDYSLLLMQTYISDNWHKGGESTYSLLGTVNMEANYNNKQKVVWDNKLELKFGLQNSRSDSVHTVKTNEDLIRLTSNIGLQASKKWYYTMKVIGQTQFAHSYKSNDRKVYGDFLAPATLNVSLGMDYKVDWINHKLKGSIHLAPIAYKLKYSRYLELSKQLGIDEGKHALHDYGSQLTAELTWEFTDMLKWKTRLYGYTTYSNAEMDWENTFNFQLNKWLAVQLFLHLRFDDSVAPDDRHGYWQFKELSSIGFSYSF